MADEERLYASEHKKTESQELTSGQWLWKKIKPAGCVAVLIMAIIAVTMCFTAGSDPIKGYEVPNDTAYYSENLSALERELNESVLPLLGGNGVAEAGDGVVTVTIDSETFASTRGAVLRYFDSSLVEFVSRDGTLAAN